MEVLGNDEGCNWRYRYGNISNNLPVRVPYGREIERLNLRYCV